MSQARKADVVVVADGGTPTTLKCLESVLDHSGPVLGRLIVVAGSTRDSEFLPGLETMAQDDSRVHLLRYAEGHGDVAAYNLGPGQDAKRMPCFSHVTSKRLAGWLDELAAFANSGAQNRLRRSANDS